MRDLDIMQDQIMYLSSFMLYQLVFYHQIKEGTQDQNV